jgi:outer membrane protein insertion porin family
VLVVDVVEKSTGEFSIGAGYSTGGETSGFECRRFDYRAQFPRPRSVHTVSAGGGKNSRDFMLSFTEPYFLGRRIAAGFDIFRQTRRYDKYESESTGGTVRFGLPITDSISTQLAYNSRRKIQLPRQLRSQRRWHRRHQYAMGCERQRRCRRSG